MEEAPAQSRNCPVQINCGESEHNGSFDDNDATESEDEDYDFPNDIPCQGMFSCDLYDGCDLSLGIALLGLCQIYKKYKLSKKCLGEIIKYIHSLLPQPTKYPRSKYKFLKILKDLSPNISSATVNYHCNDCTWCHGTENLKICERCNSNEVAVSVENDLEGLLRHFFEKRGLAQIFDKKKSRANDRNQLIVSDVTDASNYLSVERKSAYDICLIHNTDGFSIYNSSTIQIWPNFLSIVELSPALRKKFLILSDVWYGSSKPQMNNYLKSFSKTMEKLGNDGFKWTHPDLKTEIISRAYVVVSSVDAQARAVLQNINLYNGQCGCSFCEAPGTNTITNSNARYYLCDGNEYQLRSKKTVFDYASKTVNELKSTPNLNQSARSKIYATNKGVKGFSCLSFMPYFDIVDSFSPEYMHSLLLGTVKTHLLNILNSANKDQLFYLGLYEGIMSKYMKAIKPPCYVNRLPKGLDTIKNWKASELRNWLLFYSLPVLQSAGFPIDYLENYCLLVQGTYNLLKSKISLDDIRESEKLFKKFCIDYQQLYGEASMSFNMHMLLHYAVSVVKCGPLWATSTFVFENANGILKEQIHGKGNVANELINTVEIHNACSVLEYVMCSESHRQAFSVLGSCLNLETVDKVVLKFLQGIEDFESRNVKFYIRGKVNGIVYTAESYSRATKTCSHYFQYRSDQMTTCTGKLLYFCCNNQGQIVFIAKKVRLLEPFHKNQSLDICVKHIRNFTEDNDVYVWGHMKDIKRPLLLVDRFLCVPPNLHELFL
jgi:hypothetical protein